MSDADLYRQYAKEAMHGSSKVKDENEKQALVDLAFTWALAALMSDRVLRSSFVSSLCDVGEATSLRLGDLLCAGVAAFASKHESHSSRAAYPLCGRFGSGLAHGLSVAGCVVFDHNTETPIRGDAFSAFPQASSCFVFPIHSTR